MTMKRKFLVSGLILILFILTLIIVNYFKAKFFYNNMKEELSIHSNALLNGFVMFIDEPPKSKSDVDKVFNRFKERKKISNLALFNYGYNVKYDSLQDKSIIYSYGIDKEDNQLKNAPFNKLDKLGDVSVQSAPFNILTFFKSFFYADIALFEIDGHKKYNLCKIKNPKQLKDFKFLSEVGETCVVALDMNFVSRKNKIKFIEVQRKLEDEINNKDLKEEDYEMGKRKTLFFRYKNGVVTVVCDNGISKKKLLKYIKDIEQFFLTVDKSYFDYAVFPITFIGNGTE